MILTNSIYNKLKNITVSDITKYHSDVVMVARFVAQIKERNVKDGYHNIIFEIPQLTNDDKLKIAIDNGILIYFLNYPSSDIVKQNAEYIRIVGIVKAARYFEITKSELMNLIHTSTESIKCKSLDRKIVSDTRKPIGDTNTQSNEYDDIRVVKRHGKMITQLYIKDEDDWITINQ